MTTTTTTLTRSARAKAWLTLTGLFVLGVSLIWGLIIFIWSLTAHTGPAAPAPATPTSTPSGIAAAPPGIPGSVGGPVTAAQDELAARPMTLVPLAASAPQPIAATATAPSLSLPDSKDPAAALPTGFPRTPEGAVAQLAAIDTAAFRDLNPATVADVHAQATLPGAVPLREWTPQVGVTAILRTVPAPAGSRELTATWTLTHAQVKGVLQGGDFVLACVLGELDATYRSTARAGVGDCQRMLWQAGRWWIGPGAQPAFAPSTWPGSADCVRAGWQEARRA